MLKRALLALLLAGACGSARAQCTSPTSATVVINPANCAGKGSVTINSVAGGTGTYEYALYDSINVNLVKSF